MIDLARFNESDIKEIIGRFGLRLDHPSSVDSFYSSDAWEGLKAFVAAHPKLAARGAEFGEGLVGWLEKAIAENAAEAANGPRTPSP